jgi:hypothetical protein
MLADAYEVEVPGWVGPQLDWAPGLERHLRERLERLAVELAEERGHAFGARVGTVPFGEGHSALVFIDHDVRRLAVHHVSEPGLKLLRE